MINSIIEAAQILKISDNSSLNDINTSYKALLFTWHPDHCKKDPEECRVMTEKIIIAYKIICDYCYNYKFSFREETLNNPLEDTEGFWHKRFSSDPLWGNTK